MKIFITSIIITLLCGIVYATELNDIFGNYPKEKPNVVPKLSQKAFQISCDTVTGEWGRESIELFKKYTNKPGISYASRQNFVDNQDLLTLLKENNMFFFGYDWGITNEFMSYMKERDALDYTWGGLNMNIDIIDPCSHCLSTSHPESDKVWQTYAESAINCGGMGIIYCDQIQPCFYGRGVCGYNPLALEAYVKDLKGEDEGFLANIQGKKKIYKFKDYVTFYLGMMPKPKDFGFNSWDEYKPLLKKDYDPVGYEKYIIDGKQSKSFYFNVDESTKLDYVNNFILHDMLCHYEFLKFCDRLGKKAKECGGEYYSLPNPEDMSNGVDTYFLTSLCNIGGVIDEFFQSPEFLDRNYSLNDYMRENATKAGQKYGAVLEVGAGGNAFPYYNNYVAYLTAYELSATCNLDFMQGDHWPRSGEGFNLNVVKANNNLLNRVQGLLSYGNGYKFAAKDEYKKLKPDFTSVVSRRIFRPWGREWQTFSFFFGDPNKDFLPESVYNTQGYLFNTVGFEDIDRLKGKLVSWTVNTPPLLKFNNLMKKVKTGQIENVIFVAEGLDQVLDKDLNIVPLSKYYPEFKCEYITKNNISIKAEESKFGIYDPVKREAEDQLLTKTKTVFQGKEIVISGNIYTAFGKVLLSAGSIPLLYETRQGQGNIYIMTFNPSINKELAGIVTDFIMNRVGIKPKTQSFDNSTVSVYKNDNNYMVRLMNKCLLGEKWGFYNWDGTGQCPYEISSETKGSIFLKPNKTYFVLNYFDGDTIEIKTDNIGKLNLSNNKSLSVYFISEKENKDFENEIKSRRNEFSEILSL